MPKTNLKIAIVHDFLTKIGGAENVLFNIHNLFPEAPIFTLLYDKEGTNNKFEECKIMPSSLQKYPAFIRRRPKFLFGKFSRAIEEFDFSQYDIVISSSNSFAHGIITKPNTFHLCYCHSPMRYVWDWTNEYIRENRVGYGLKGLIVRNMIHKNRIWDKISSNRVDRWTSNSSNVANRIKKYYGFDAKVIYPPSNISEIKLSKNEPDEYYVVVSRLEPYKKIDLAIDAFNKSGKQLIVIGIGSELTALQKRANKNIEFLGWQSDESVHEYIRNAKALIFPGEEDFGLTPVEAMACGRPVIAYRSGGVLESVIDGKTGLFFNEQTAESIIDAVDRLESSYDKYNQIACRKRAEQFSTEKFNEKFLSFLNQSYDEHIQKMSEIIK